MVASNFAGKDFNLARNLSKKKDVLINTSFLVGGGENLRGLACVGLGKREGNGKLSG